MLRANADAMPTEVEIAALARLLAAMPNFSPWHEPEMAPFAKQRELIEMLALEMADAPHLPPPVFLPATAQAE